MTGITGTLRRIDDRRGAVRVEGLYDTDIDDLWSALTTPQRLARWIAAVQGDLHVGGVIHASFTSSWEGPGRIDVCDAPTRLAITLEPGNADETVIEAILAPDGDGTRLVVEERGLPLDVLHLHGAGWQAHLEDLERCLAGKESAWKSRWEELAPRYQALGLTALDSV